MPSRNFHRVGVGRICRVRCDQVYGGPPGLRRQAWRGDALSGMTRVWMIGVLMLAGFSLPSMSTAAADAPAEQEAQGGSAAERLEPVVGVSFSWPLIMSYSLGAGYELGNFKPGQIFTDSPSLRLDMDVGIAGGYLSAGMALPFGHGNFAVNLKAARLRTWLLDLGIDPWRNFNGGIVEFVTFGHVPGKVGIGWFRSADRSRPGDGELWYASLGAGW